jgi:VirE N-terminal domain/Family of unknown function (DUF5906)
MNKANKSEIALTLFDTHRDETGQTVTLGEVIARIKDPEPALGAIIREIRGAYSVHAGGKDGKNAIRALKGRLPCVSFSANGTRKVASRPTGFVVLDFDGLGVSLKNSRATLETDPHVAVNFLSPSGDGLKAIVSVPVPTGTEAEMRLQHRQAFWACCNYVVQRRGLPEPDQSGKDMLRLCYLSHDPHVSFNPNAIPLDVAAWLPKLDETPSDDPAARDLRDEARTAGEEVVEALLQSIPPRPDYSTWLKIAASVRNSLKSDERAVAILKAWSPEEEEGEYLALLRSSPFSKIGFGTLHFHARSHSFWGVKGRFFYSGRRGYAMRSGSKFISLPSEDQVKQHLKVFGVRTSSKEPECHLCDIRTEQYVSYIGEVAGHPSGLDEFNGDRFLVTKGPTIIEAAPGDGSFVLDFITRLLVVDEDQTQLQNFLAWLSHCRRCVKAGKRGQNPALAIAGTSGNGKSLLIEIVRRCLGGRAANGYRYLSGATNFNGDLVGAELIFADDEAASTDHRSRLKLAQNLKNHLFAGSVRVEAKGRDAFNCKPVQAVMLAVNNDPQHLRVLPELDDTMRDKIILLVSQPNALPQEMLARTDVGRTEAIAHAIDRALPGFLYDLESRDFRSQYNAATGRLLCYWNPQIVEGIDALSPEMQLLELARNCPEITNALENDEQWVGTASQLESILTRSDAQTRHAGVRLLSWTNSCGILLSKLADNPEAGVQKVGLTVSSRIQQYRIGALNGCEAEEVRSSLATSL